MILFLSLPVEGIYSALSECQALYPDPELSSDSQADEDEEEVGEGVELIQDDESARGVFYTSAEEGIPHLSPQGRVSLTLNHQLRKLFFLNL